MSSGVFENGGGGGQGDLDRGGVGHGVVNEAVFGSADDAVAVAGIVQAGDVDEDAEVVKAGGLLRFAGFHLNRETFHV